MKLMTTFEEKQQYFDRVKLQNYRASMKLEGYEPALKNIPESQEARDQMKQAIINEYINKNR